MREEAAGDVGLGLSDQWQPWLIVFGMPNPVTDWT